MPASPVGTKLSWYFINCAEVLLTRTSDWKWEPMPLAFATAGMTSASGGGVFFGVGVTGVTRLTPNGTVTLVPSAFTRPDSFRLTVTDPRLVPGGRPAVLAVTVRVMPPSGTTPDAGET